MSEPFRQICENMADHFDELDTALLHARPDPAKPTPESTKSLPAHLALD